MLLLFFFFGLFISLNLVAVSIVGIWINSFSQPPLCGRIPTKSLVKPFNVVTFCYRQLSYSYHFDLTVFRKLSGPSNRLVLFFFFFFRQSSKR